MIRGLGVLISIAAVAYFSITVCVLYSYFPIFKFA